MNAIQQIELNIYEDVTNEWTNERMNEIVLSDRLLNSTAKGGAVWRIKTR